MWRCKYCGSKRFKITAVVQKKLATIDNNVVKEFRNSNDTPGILTTCRECRMSAEKIEMIADWEG